jgi:hypothetical protein
MTEAEQKDHEALEEVERVGDIARLFANQTIGHDQPSADAALIAAALLASGQGPRGYSLPPGARNLTSEGVFLPPTE